MKLFTINGAAQGTSGSAAYQALTTQAVKLNLELVSQILPPNGNVASTSNGPNVITFMQGATAISASVQNPPSVLQEIDNFLNNGNGAFESEDPGLFPTLTSVTPFSIKAGSGGTISIVGNGFAAATLGNVWIEDFTGGMDSNGVSFTMTFVDAQHLTGAWASNGDGGTPTDGTNVILYYQDTNLFQTNALVVTLHL